MKKVFACFILLSCMIIGGCAQSDSSKLIGSWTEDSYNPNDYLPNNIDFYDDGTGTVNHFKSEYELLDNHQVKLTISFAGTQVYTWKYAIVKNKLMLQRGNKKVYYKKAE